MTTETMQDAAQQRGAEPRLARKALLATLDDRKTILALIQRRPYTMISITSWYSGETYTGVGFSKVCYPDAWSDEQGADIACRRALIDILHQVRWDEYTRHLPWNEMIILGHPGGTVEVHSANHRIDTTVRDDMFTEDIASW